MATDNKYDRQLRLWGADGQRALASSHVCLLHAGPTGSEALKHLELPGIGAFTVVDGARVTERALRANAARALDPQAAPQSARRRAHHAAP